MGGIESIFVKINKAIIFKQLCKILVIRMGSLLMDSFFFYPFITYIKKEEVMKKFLFATVTLLVFSGSTIWSQTQSLKMKQDKQSASMFLENESKYGFDETIEKLKIEIEKKSWKLTATHDLQETMKKNGKDVLPVMVFAMCHPKHSGKILEKDDERIVSTMMPCRVSVYAKSNGKTYISRMNPSIMASTFGGLIEQVMTDSATEVEEIISALIVMK